MGSLARRWFAQQWPCSIPANGDDRRLADSKQLRIGILHANPNGIARRQVHPVESPLNVGQSLFELSDDIRVGSNSKTYAVHHTRKLDVRLRHDINISPHSRLDVRQLSFAKVSNRPPYARINQREHLLPHMHVCSFRDRQVRYKSVEGRVHAAVIEIIASVL